jgi:hypothetical protein
MRSLPSSVGGVCMFKVDIDRRPFSNGRARISGNGMGVMIVFALTEFGRGHARDEGFATKCYQTEKWGICN